MQIKEQKRIIDFTDGQIPSTGHLIFTVTTVNSSEKLNLIKEVMLVINEFNEDNWPEDKIWDIKLPEWFISKIKSHDIDEIKQNNLLWEYGSWLDAMKFRGWEWFSSQITSTGFTIILEPYSFPFSVDPLEYVIWESGVKVDAIRFEYFSTK